MKRELYIGRFQPYANGHKAFIEQIANEADELIIGIEGVQISHDLQHPFTAGQRIMMISRDLKDLGIPVYVIPLTDVKESALWVSHVRSMVPPFGIAYTANPLLVRLFLESGVDVIYPGTCPHEVLPGRELCSLMAIGDAWKAHVPEETIQVILEVGGVERIRCISQSDA